MKTQNEEFKYEYGGDVGLDEDFLKRLGWLDEDRQKLVELSDSPFWPVIKKYYQLIDYIVTLNLRSTDPFKNPTIMAQNQGIAWAVGSLEKYIERAKAKSEKEAGSENIRKGQK